MATAPLRLAALTWTRIDGDVLEEFIRHTARFVDHHFIVDLESPDATSSILQALIVEGFPITIWRLSGSSVVDGDFVTINQHARTVLKQEAFDYVLLLDADEFIVARDREQIDETLRGLPEGAHARLRWLTYVPAEDDDPNERRILARIRFRRALENIQFFKVFLHRSFAEHFDWWIEAGNHDVTGPDCTVLDIDIALAHFPVRDVRQIQAKALLGWTALLAAGYDEKKGLAFHWRDLYLRLVSGEKWTRDDLPRIARDYLGKPATDTESGAQQLVFDPLPVVPQRCTGDPPELIEVAFSLTRQLATAYSEARRATAAASSILWPTASEAIGSIDLLDFVDVTRRNAKAGDVPIVPSGSRLIVKGWIAIPDPLEAPHRIYAMFPGRTIELPCLSRPDVAEAFECEALDASGFYGEISLDGFEEGAYQLHMAAQNAAGCWYVLRSGAAFDVVPSSLAFAGTRLEPDAVEISVDRFQSLADVALLEEPPALQKGDMLTVRGKAVDRMEDGSAREVFAVVDGTHYVMGLCGLKTRDDERSAGFVVEIRTESLSIGSHTLAIAALAADETAFSLFECGTFELRTRSIPPLFN
ncbi:MAG: glycosyltransferase family 2 protein [Candidatus Baltobacteraceae bacterium]